MRNNFCANAPRPSRCGGQAKRRVDFQRFVGIGRGGLNAPVAHFDVVNGGLGGGAMTFNVAMGD